MSDSRVSEFYDEFSSYQINTGFNKRHYSILNWCEKFGMKNGMRILEIGCGIGTVSRLMAEKFSKSEFHCYDLSPKSIEIAKKESSNFSNLRFETADITEVSIIGEFDWVVMPDVLEHIPVELHSGLFKKLFSIVKDGGAVLIHIPNPYFLDSERRRAPELLQAIDQSLYPELIVPSIRNAGFVIEHLQDYTIWKVPADYQVILLRKRISWDFKDSPIKLGVIRRFVSKIFKVK